MDESQDTTCPISALHTRIMNAWKFWLDADRHYADIDELIRNVNSCIQELRNVTFVLQKQKVSIPDFDKWYGHWQKIMKDDSVLKWLVSARDKIVHEADLEIFSTLRVVVFLDYNISRGTEIEWNPLAKTPGIIKDIVKRFNLPNPLPDKAVLTLNRRWVKKN